MNFYGDLRWDNKDAAAKIFRDSMEFPEAHVFSPSALLICIPTACMLAFYRNFEKT